MIIYIVVWLLVGAASVFVGSLKVNLPPPWFAILMPLFGPTTLVALIAVFYMEGAWRYPWIHPRDLRWP